MKSIRCAFDHAAIPSEIVTSLNAKAAPEIDRISAAWGSGYDTEYASLSLPSDADLVARVKALGDEKKRLDPALLVVIGIGGSNLGTLAVLEALGTSGSCQVAFADTVDAPYISAIHSQAEQLLKSGKNVVVVVISKSGTTTETVANAQIFAALLGTYDKMDGLVVISDEGSKLTQLAHTHNLSHLLIAKQVGGRFSLFSAVGLFPLYMMGVDIDQLLAGAQSMKEPCTADTLQENPALSSAATLYHYYHKGMVIHDTFAFAHSLKGIADWYRQLLAESIGKATTKSGKKVHVGITPTTSIGSVDLHSVAQLYLAGPNIRTTTFLTVDSQKDMQLPAGNLFDELVPMIHGKSLHDIMDAIVQGTQKAYQHEHRPYMTIELPELSAYYCGQFFQMKMVEIMYLGFLFDINPFDQPQVELYKKETRKILSHE